MEKAKANIGKKVTLDIFKIEMKKKFGNKVNDDLLEKIWSIATYGEELPKKLMEFAYDGTYYQNDFYNRL